MMHSLVLSRGSIVATVVWKQDVRHFELQILDAEIRESLDFTAISRLSGTALGVPSVASTMSGNNIVGTVPAGVHTVSPTFNDVQRAS